MERYTETLSMELEPFGIHVVSLQPGEYNTKIATSRLKPATISAVYEKSYARTMDVLGSSLHYSRDPDELAQVVKRILNDPKPKARYVVPQAIQKISILPKKRLPGRMFERMVRKHY